MTDAPKLLTEAEWLERIASWGVGEGAHLALADLRERGLVADEPVDPLLIEAREIVAGVLDAADLPGVARTTREGDEDDSFRVQVALAALKRGREMGLAERPELTREMVEKAYRSVWGRYNSNNQIITALHAALTGGAA